MSAIYWDRDNKEKAIKPEEERKISGLENGLREKGNLTENSQLLNFNFLLTKEFLKLLKRP
jgi:hypothetical protein